MTENNKNEGPFKVFFIASNQSSYDNKLEYSLSKNGMINFKKVFSKIEKYKGEDFTILVFTFDIIKNDLRKNDYDTLTKKYKAIVKLKQKGRFKMDTKFEGFILFKETKNNFIFDFKFEDYHGYMGIYNPPPSMKMDHKSQIKIYNEAFRSLKIKQDSPFSNDLILDSRILLIGKKYEIDLFLELFKSCYAKKPVKTLLMCFNVQKVLLPSSKFEPKNYTSILQLIEKKPEVLTKYCDPKDNPQKYYKLFFTLLLYFRLNFEKDKVQELLSKKDLWVYFKEILPKNYISFSTIEIPSELLNQMLQQTPLSFQIIEGSLFYLKSFEKILISLNENNDLIFEVCKKEKKAIKINDLSCPNKDDNIENILKEIEKLINYEIKKGKFVLFEEEFFNNYNHYYLKKNLKNLLLIKKIILICKKIDKELDPDYNSIIHETALEMIKKGELKNDELLDFIGNDDIYFIENKNEYFNLNYRPLAVFDGFDLENINDKFCEKWNKVNIFKKYSFLNNNNAEKYLIDKINHMKDFWKLLKLFNFENENLLNKISVELILIKFKKLIKTYSSDTCPNFIKETCLLIYSIDKKISRGKYFMENIIEKDIKSLDLINDIYLYLSSNYKDISNNIVDHITNYFIRNLQNKNIVKGENLLFLLKKLNSVTIFKAILNKISNYAIKEEELFNEEKDVDSFKLLEGIQNEKMIEKYPILNETNYILSTITLEDKISNNIKKGNIKYNIVNSWYLKKEKNKLLRDRLNILFFHNENDVKNCMEAIKKYFVEITKAISYIVKLNTVLNNFYVIKHEKDIKFLDNFEKQLKDGMLNIIEKKEIKDILQKIHQILPEPDLEKKNTLKNSVFFTNFFKNMKDNEPLKKEDEIFLETEKNFEKLKLLFEPNWITNIDERIIKECYKIIKRLEENLIEKELKLLKKYFNLEEINELDIARIKDEIIVFSKKEEIFQTVNSCLFFISELKAIPTDFSSKLKKLRSEISKNITVDKIKEYGQSLEKYGINILNPKKEERDYLDILNALYNKKGSLQFIVKLTANDCRRLQEVVSEIDNTFLTGVEINIMEKCSNFMNKVLGDRNVQKNDIDLISSFIKEVPQEKNISAFFINYATNSGQIQELFSQNLDKSQTNLKKIRNILNKSSFMLSIENNKDSYFKFFGNYTNEE